MMDFGNLCRHGEKSRKPVDICYSAGEWQNEFIACQVKKNQRIVTQQLPIVWTPPQLGNLKMNFDGALDPINGICGLGVVFRDHFGVLKGAMAVPQFGYLSPISVEALALLHGLRFAAYVGFGRLEIEGDVLSIITSLQVECDDLSLEGHLLEEVKRLVEYFEFCSSHFVKREGN